jgi:N-acyl-D-amino-acid deacylase
MIRHLLISEKLEVSQATFAMKEENLRKIYAHPLSMPASDGSVYSPEGVLGKELPHPRSYGTFPRFFETFVREEKIVDMATAIYKCTGLPASRAKFKERGLLIPGYAADITVFDPETIADKATYAKPHTFPSGIVHVFVNGVWTIKEGVHTGALAGMTLLR